VNDNDAPKLLYVTLFNVGAVGSPEANACPVVAGTTASPANVANSQIVTARRTARRFATPRTRVDRTNRIHSASRDVIPRWGRAERASRRAVASAFAGFGQPSVIADHPLE
jgi:hypothetical protein